VSRSEQSAGEKRIKTLQEGKSLK